ncbi:response regulator [Phaeovulum sp. W22_SRMD_FR3]|jgi:two-component system, NarL family, nitrate/nitrite response regulator NarL|uniref:response regulator n=1 Tax=Phaeovulum sp. W22_SRMD_FR3 TaxID=3240274 RepID=UPI003F9C1C46
MGVRANLITVGIVDDHEVVRQGLSAILAQQRSMRVIGEGASAPEAVSLAIKYRPDVMLLDITMPGGGLEALKTIVSKTPEVRCVILTACDDASVAMAAITAGARGFILKGVSSGNLLAAIEVVMADQSYVSPEFAARLMDAALQVKLEGAPSLGLSRREEQVLREVEKGLTNREVADRLHLSEKTVKHYMTSVMQKFGVSNRVGAIRHLQGREHDARGTGAVH